MVWWHRVMVVTVWQDGLGSSPTIGFDKKVTGVSSVVSFNDMSPVHFIHVRVVIRFCFHEKALDDDRFLPYQHSSTNGKPIQPYRMVPARIPSTHRSILGH